MKDAEYCLFSFCGCQRMNAGDAVIEGIGVKRDGVAVSTSELSILWCDPKKKAVMKWLKRQSVDMNWALVDVNGIEHVQVLDLNDDGERWEGDVLDDQPCGWGVLYDKGNNKEYEGFRVGDVNVCYGTRYYSDLGVIEYEGEWCEGKRWGRGVQFDRKGGLQYEGEWMNDAHVERRVVLDGENPLLHNHIEELIVSNNSCNGKEWNVLDLSFMSNLRLLQVGNGCFMYVIGVKLIGLEKLERVAIGKGSFSTDDPFNGGKHCRFQLKNCPLIRELRIGCFSFNYCSVCEIENVPSLEVIEMKELNERSCSFFNASLELKSDSQRMK